MAVSVNDLKFGEEEPTASSTFNNMKSMPLLSSDCFQLGSHIFGSKAFHGGSELLMVHEL
jgi:hypothetical protein